MANESAAYSPATGLPSLVDARARIAVYDDLLSSPRVIDLAPAPILEFIEAIATTTYSEARALGGSLPYTVIREIAENFIHANFKECTVSVLERGNTISFSDQGPGIEKKLLVQQPGISSATAEMKRFIKGVGSGFPIVKEYLQIAHGHLSITDNAIDGTVVTLSVKPAAPGVFETASAASFAAPSLANASARLAPTSSSDARSVGASSEERSLPLGGGLSSSGALPPAASSPLASLAASASTALGTSGASFSPALTLSEREEQTLLLAAELGAVGPGDLKERLDLSAPTISRLLKTLERRGLLEPAARRKRILSNAGLHFLEERGAVIAPGLQD
jgi:DNA-binding transcriptional ArsR family regulator